eukprot:6152821-Pleurochrysis_carterae.AAC.1
MLPSVVLSFVRGTLQRTLRSFDSCTAAGRRRASNVIQSLAPNDVTGVFRPVVFRFSAGGLGMLLELTSGSGIKPQGRPIYGWPRALFRCLEACVFLA